MKLVLVLPGCSKMSTIKQKHPCVIVQLELTRNALSAGKPIKQVAHDEARCHSDTFALSAQTQQRMHLAGNGPSMIRTKTKTEESLKCQLC